MPKFYKQFYLFWNDLSVSVISWQVSIVARQQGGRLSHYHTRSGDSLELLYPGEMSAEVSQQHEIFCYVQRIFFIWVYPCFFTALNRTIVKYYLNTQHDSEIVICTFKREDLLSCSFPLRNISTYFKDCAARFRQSLRGCRQKKQVHENSRSLTSVVFRLSALFVEAGYIFGSCETSILHSVRISNISSG